MPGFWTHIIVGEQVKNKIENPTFKKTIENNQKIYNFGCQGPDFLYFNNFWPWLKDKRGNKAGGELHAADIKSLFLLGIQYIKQELDEDYFNKMLSYFCGFIIHFISDILYHKSILKKIETNEEHISMEIKLDTYLVSKVWHKEAYFIDSLKKVNIGNALPFYIENFYKKILSAKTDYHLNLNYINSSYKDFKRLFKILYTPGNIKRKLLFLADYFISWNIKNVIYPLETEFPVFQEDYEKEFDDILFKAVNISTRLLTGVYNYMIYQIDKDELSRILDESKKAVNDVKFSQEDISQVASL